MFVFHCAILPFRGTTAGCERGIHAGFRDCTTSHPMRQMRRAHLSGMRHRAHRARRAGARTGARLRIVIGAVATLACGDVATPSIDEGVGCGEDGTFTATITGAVRAQLLGCSVYAVVGSGNSTAFLLLLYQGRKPTPPDLLTVVRLGGRPGPGVYGIGPDTGKVALTYERREPGLSRAFTATTGGMSVTLASADGVNGSVDLTAADASLTIHIIGSFRAKCGVLAPGSTC